MAAPAASNFEVEQQELSAPKSAPSKRKHSPEGKALPEFYGGFKGLGGPSVSTYTDKRKKREAQMTESQITHINPTAVRCAEVPFNAWAAQKEKRVSTAFSRIIERDWYDKYEMTLRPVERAHMNAVREHYAMRRDKIKTPDVNARPKSNTLTQKGWAESMEALEVLNRDTNVGDFFHGLVGKTIAKRLRKQAKAENEAKKAAAAAAEKPPMQF